MPLPMSPGQLPLLASQTEHEALARIALQHAGIHLGSSKRQLLSSRLLKRMRALEISSFRSYLDYLTANPDREMAAFINSITTNLTAFFRENHHFEHLREQLDDTRRGRRLKIWSAGCSSGEEAYSIAMVVIESGVLERGVSVQIVGSDIDTECVARARQGVYPLEGLKGLDDARLRRHCLRGSGRNEGLLRIRSELRSMIEFKVANLLGRWPFEPPVDVIFCRNVAIYFDAQTQQTLFDRIARALAADGRLFIGHSENLTRVSDHFELLGSTIYTRADR